MSDPLVIVALLDAKPGQEEALLAALQELIPTTRAEAGCERYDLHRSTTEPGHFQFHERWTTRELWQQHMNAPHLEAFSKVSESLVASWKLYELKHTA